MDGTVKRILSISGLLYFGLFLSMANCFSMVIITMLDVFSRHLLNRAIPGVIELNEVLMVGIVFLGLGMAQKEKSHIRAELLVSRLSKGRRKLSDLLATICSLGFWGILLFQSAPRAWDAFLTGEYREGLIKFPLWPARGALALGLFILCLQLLVDLYRETTSRSHPSLEPQLKKN
jgi:TRAP-type transport system small permease protein